MKTKITVTLTLDDGTPTPNDVQNAVRRALTVPTLKDVPLSAKMPLVVKGVTVKARHVNGKTPTYTPSPVRVWAVENGHPDIAGKRGRISKAIIAEYKEATK